MYYFYSKRVTNEKRVCNITEVRDNWGVKWKVLSPQDKRFCTYWKAEWKDPVERKKLREHLKIGNNWGRKILKDPKTVVLRAWAESLTLVGSRMKGRQNAVIFRDGKEDRWRAAQWSIVFSRIIHGQLILWKWQVVTHRCFSPPSLPPFPSL